MGSNNNAVYRVPSNIPSLARAATIANAHYQALRLQHQQGNSITTEATPPPGNYFDPATDISQMP